MKGKSILVFSAVFGAGVIAGLLATVVFGRAAPERYNATPRASSEKESGLGLPSKVLTDTDWAKLRQVLEQYVEYPSAENAELVMACLPKSGPIKLQNTIMENKTFQFIEEHMDMLDYQVLARDCHAVCLAFRLRTILDGALAESSDVTLGRLIRIDPRLFLHELANHEGEFSEGLVGNNGGEFVDLPKAQAREDRLRIDALMTVQDPELRRVRDRCVRLLEEDYRRMSAITQP